MTPSRRSLRTELLVNLGIVTSAAVILVGVTTAAIGGDFSSAARPLLALWVGSTLVFLSFGTYVVSRVVLRPLARLTAEADVLAAGDLANANREYDTEELAYLASRYRAMAADVLDLQGHAVRVEKLAGIGRLASGIAHEVRNPLGALSTYVEVLRRHNGDAEVLQNMRTAIERIDRTIETLVNYARPAVATGETDLNAAVRTAVDFLLAQGLLKAGDLALALEAKARPVRGDRHALEQVILNLVINACQAAPGGQVTIGTVSQVLSPAGQPRVATCNHVARDDWRPLARRPRRPDLTSGTPGVLLYVADEGPGVSEADREQIFDPFFTTKAPGEGSGLGLAIVARVVYDAGGVVWVDRAREGGAVFKVFMPLAGMTNAPADC